MHLEAGPANSDNVLSHVARQDTLSAQTNHLSTTMFFSSIRHAACSIQNWKDLEDFLKTIQPDAKMPLHLYFIVK